uniref:S24 family peptidase n=1 Tax=Alloprevotella sp. TaxID=1872471 RepID=UPI003FEE557B
MILERIKQYIDYKSISVAAFEKSIGMSNASFGKCLKKGGAIGTDKLENILSVYPDISPNWLLTGNGDMLRNTTELTPTKDGTGIPLIPVEAMAGCFTGSQTVLLQECDHYVVPAFKNADFLIYVRGDSMQPRYYSGDMVACKMLSPTDLFFQWGKVYVLDTDQGALIKKVEQGTDDETITLVSENENYKPFQIPRRAIYHIAIVMGLIRTE